MSIRNATIGIRRSPLAILHLIALAASCLLLAGCDDTDGAAASRATADSLIFEDDLHHSLRFDEPAQRLLALAPNLTEIAYAAGAGDRLVGASTSDDYPPAVDTLPRFSSLPLDFEAIAALEPDLVLATDQVNNPRDAETLEALGIPTAFFSFDTVSDILGAVEDVGRLAGTAEHAEDSADSLRRAYRRLQKQTGALPEHPRVLFLIGDETLYAFGRYSYVQDLIDAAGGESLTADIDRRAPVLSEEFVLEQQPDVIVGAWGADYDVERLVELHPAWREVPAIREGRVHSVEPDYLLRPGPRVVEGARRLAALLHPDHFASPDTTARSAR